MNLLRRINEVFMVIGKTKQPQKPGGSIHNTIRKSLVYPNTEQNCNSITDFRTLEALGRT